MLVLTRKKNEKIRIGSEVIVTIVEIIGDRVRLGITAPTDIQIMREELIPRIQQEQTRKEQQAQHGLERPAP